MAKYKYHLQFSVTGEQTLSDEQIKEYFRGQKIRVVKVNKGTIFFQNEEAKEKALEPNRTFSVKGCSIQLIGNTSGTSEENKPCLDLETETSISPETPVALHFYNPYHFLNSTNYTPRYPYAPHDRFKDNCGKLRVEVKFVSPGFIPDPDLTRHIITDDTLRQEDEDRVAGNIHAVLEKFLEKKPGTQKIRFDPDCRGWNGFQPGEHVTSLNNTSEKVRNWPEGRICKMKDSGKYYVETTEPNRWAHKVMDFFQINGKPVIPGTSIKGMLRTRIETLSNGCFLGYEDHEDDLSHTFHRLDVSKVHRSEMKLEAVVLRKSDNNTWEYVKVDHAKILSSHIFNRIGAKEDSELAVYRNRKGCFEKISVTGKDEGPKKSTGLHAYNWKKNRGDIRAIADKNEIRTDNYSVIRIKDEDLSCKEYNKTFPFVKDFPIDDSKQLWAIIRFKREIDDFGREYRLYKIKMISNDFDELKQQLENFENPVGNPDSANSDVQYEISEIRIKTAFDMDTKTQHQAFFIFGETDFDAAVNQRNAVTLSEVQVNQFKSLLQQRKVNSEKLPRDPEKINQRMARVMPENLRDGMLAFWHGRNNNGYLTYTMVPQKPYKYSPRDILKKQDKLACNQLEKLCPACQLFGTVSLNQEHPNFSAQKLTAIKGKISVSHAAAVNNQSGQREWATLRPLSTPKPTYYPFYIMDNHGSGDDNRPFRDYDSQNIRIGRKVYLHHPSDRLSYKGSQRTNLNSTIRPIPKDSCFEFEITFTNLTNYELGLLLYSLNMHYQGEKTGCHIGMGKPLGLGSCRLCLKEVTLTDPSEYYKDINNNDGKTVLHGESPIVRKGEMLYRHVQSAKDKDKFAERRDKVNATGLTKTSMPADEESIRTEYLSQKHIHDYHILSSINVHSKKYKMSLPVIYAGGMEKSFEWYKKAKERQERLFVPEEFEDDFSDDGQRQKHSLSSET